MIWRSLKPTFFQLFRLTTGRRNRLRASAEISEKFSEKFFTAWKPNLLAPHFILFQRHLSVPYSLAPRPAAELARPRIPASVATRFSQIMTLYQQHKLIQASQDKIMSLSSKAER